MQFNLFICLFLALALIAPQLTTYKYVYILLQPPWGAFLERENVWTCERVSVWTRVRTTNCFKPLLRRVYSTCVEAHSPVKRVIGLLSVHNRCSSLATSFTLGCKWESVHVHCSNLVCNILPTKAFKFKITAAAKESELRCRDETCHNNFIPYFHCMVIPVILGS
jgi:hypothetical protein